MTRKKLIKQLKKRKKQIHESYKVSERGDPIRAGIEIHEVRILKWAIKLAKK